MSDVDRDAIALVVIPGSHRGWDLMDHESYYDDPPMGYLGNGFQPFQRHRVPLDRVDDDAEVLLPMEAGDGLFFTNYTCHRSEPNRSAETLAFYAIAYKVAGT
jgi:ectoine hydroxylase-related dioxygenase (phytanoyl-CoA dioxygenase family)